MTRGHGSACAPRGAVGAMRRTCLSIVICWRTSLRISLLVDCARDGLTARVVMPMSRTIDLMVLGSSMVRGPKQSSRRRESERVST
jgi:hypothetical protein